MSKLSIGDDVSKIVLGDKTLWERPDYDTTWVEVPDNGGSGDFKGLEFMSYNPNTSLARFLGFRKLVVPFGTPSKKRLMMSLPEGYKFSDDNENSILCSYVDNSVFNEYKLNLAFEGDCLYATFGDANINLDGYAVIYPHIHIVKSGTMLYTNYDEVFTNTLTFKVIKED